MPQSIPLEASETLAFTPPSLEGIEGAPVFTLRYPTRRDKRFINRLLRESGARTHSDEVIRAAVLDELKASWNEADYARFAPIIEEYWKALDAFVLIQQTDPEAVFEYDEAIVRSTTDLIRLVSESSARICKMRADNSEFNELAELCTLAVVVKDWTGLSTVRVLERGYLTIDCAADMIDDLTDYAGKVLDKERAGIPYAELMIQAFRNQRLEGDEEKNSASPSPSGTPQTSSKMDSDHGQSKASASSPTTPATE